MSVNQFGNKNFMSLALGPFSFGTGVNAPFPSMAILEALGETIIKTFPLTFMDFFSFKFRQIITRSQTS